MSKDKKVSRPALRWLSSVAGKAKLYIAILLLLQILINLNNVGFALFLRQIVNSAVAGEPTAFFRASAFFAALVTAQLAMRAISRYYEELSRSTLENRFKKNLFDALLTRDYAAVTETHSGEWMNRLTSDTVVVADGMTQILPNVAGMSVKIAGAVGAILWLEPRFLFIAVPSALLLIIFSTLFRKVLKRLHKKIQESDGLLRVFLSERLESLLIVRTFAREEDTGRQADELMQQHKQARMQRNHFSNFSNIGFGAAMNGAYVFSAIYCGWGILHGTISYGDFMAILQLVSQVQTPLASITSFLPKYYAMLASAERLQEAELFDPDRELDRTSEDLQHFYQSDFQGIRLRRAAFSYQPPTGANSGTDGDLTTPEALTELDLDIMKGDYVALTGPSGCGKSTVLKILLCLYPLDEGERLLLTRNGPLPLTSEYRRLFAYVPQGNQLLSGTIREIITFGDPSGMRDEKGICHALRTACAEEFVEQLPYGIDTVLGERGSGLSEGQMQRIAIARAIYSEHPVLLLDEATSSLDIQTEQQLLHNLQDMTDRTVILVTHRHAALTICDRIMDFGSGKDDTP